MPVDSEVCCCTSSCWTKTIGWLQILGGGCGVVLMALALANFDQLKFPQELEEIRPSLASLFWCALVEFVVSFILGVILVWATTSRETSLMWTWIVVESVLVLASLIARIVAGTNLGYKTIVPTVIVNLVIFAFMVRSVHSRIKDVKAAQSVKPCEEKGNCELQSKTQHTSRLAFMLIGLWS